MLSYRHPCPKQRKILGTVPKTVQIIQSCKFVCCFCFCFLGSCCFKKTSFVCFKFSKETRTWEFSDSFQTTGRFPSPAISAKPRQEVLRNPSLPPSCRIAFLCLPDSWVSRDLAFEGFRHPPPEAPFSLSAPHPSCSQAYDLSMTNSTPARLLAGGCSQSQGTLGETRPSYLILLQ